MLMVSLKLGLLLFFFLINSHSCFSTVVAKVACLLLEVYEGCRSGEQVN
jgi:hypothetical protein